MAKKPATVRVFQVAKELGVQSKDIVAKCHAEDIPNVTNHMSTVSAGLAATIREWFNASDSSVATAVEIAPPVDVEKARAKVRRKASPKKAPARQTTTEAEPVSDTPEEAPATTERPVETPRQAPAPAAEAPPAAAEAPVEAPEPVAEAPVEEAAPAQAEDESSDAVAPGVKPIMNVPNRPELIKPAGPMLDQPKKTKLAGPRVIRVEKADVIEPPRSRSARPSGRSAPPGFNQPEAPAAPGDRGRGSTSSRRNRRRTGTPAREEPGRTGRSAVAPDADRQFNWREQDLLERERRLSRSGGFFKAQKRDRIKRESGGGHRAITAAQGGGVVRLPQPVTIKDLSRESGVKAADILKKLFLAGKPATINSVIDPDDAIAIMLEYDIELAIEEQQSVEEQIAAKFVDRDNADEQPRSPVVTILGHVDHGKTSLLDRIRSANVAEGEAGGITQATSAFRVPVHVGDNEHVVTFIDTPGHEAFTEMRSRGAKVTDIVVLVVAADDGVMPQTVESINHAKAAGVPIVVALNKIDKPEATDTNIQRIFGQLAEHELNPTEWGGSTEIVRTSALKGEGIQDLLELLDYQAELLDLKADFSGNAEGTVLEAQVEEGRGPVARLLVQQGKLSKGDVVVVGRAYGRVRDIVNDRGERVDSAGPSSPVAISGINEVPDAGDKFYVVKNIREAEAAAGERQSMERQRSLATEKITLDNIFQHLADNERKELPLIIKGDVQGSLETLRATLPKISTDEVVVEIKHAAVGGVNESDVGLAEAAGAIIVGFNVTASAKARKLAEQKGVDIRFYDVIYDLTDDVKKAAEGLLEPEVRLEVLGHAEVREVFRISKVGMIAGCYVTDGAIERNSQIRVTRDGIVVEKDRRLEQLKRFKDDVKEVRSGQECGMKIDGYDDIKVGDVLECYRTREVRRTL